MLVGSSGSKDKDDDKKDSSSDGWNTGDAEDESEESEEDDEDEDEGGDDDKDEDEGDGQGKKESKSEPPKSKSHKSPGAASAADREAQRMRALQKEWRAMGKEMLDRIKEARGSNRKGSGSGTTQGVSDPTELDAHVCSKCENKDSLGQFECALWTSGIYRKDDPNQFRDREGLYNRFQEETVPAERRFLALIAKKFNNADIPGNWLPGVGVGITEDDWMNIGDNKLRTGGGEPARLAALAESRSLLTPVKSKAGPNLFALPPFNIEYINEDKGYGWVARRFIPRGEEMWREAAYTYPSLRDEDGTPVDWEEDVDFVLSQMYDKDRKHFLILPPHPQEYDLISGAKLGKLTRIFNRWSIGCEADESGGTARFYAPAIGFLNHSCIPNAQQSLGLSPIIPSDEQTQEMAAQFLAAAKEDREQRKKGKGNEGDLRSEYGEDDIDEEEIKRQAQEAASLPQLTIFIHATRDIDPGMEITVQYMTSLSVKESRNEILLNNFGFQCACHLCMSDRTEYETIMGALDNAQALRRTKAARKEPVKCIQECSGSLWSLLSMDMFDIRYPRLLEETADMLAMHTDRGRAFFFYMMAERIYQSIENLKAPDVERTRMKTDALFARKGKSKRGLSSVEDSLLLYLNEDYIMELLLLLGVKNNKYHRLPTYRKHHRWLKTFDREKYIHERTQMELDMVAEWTETWMETRLQYLWKHKTLKGVRNYERKRRDGASMEDAEAEMLEEEGEEAAGGKGQAQKRKKRAKRKGRRKR